MSLEKQKPLYLQAYEYLKNDILKGNFAPGQKLTDQYLSSYLGISRTPVREAARILCKDGLLNTNDRGHLIVFDPTPEDIVEIYINRSSLQSIACGLLAADDRVKDFVPQLYSLVQEGEKHPDKPEKIRNINWEFHQKLVNLTNNKMLINSYEILEIKMRFIRGFTLKKKTDIQTSVQEHIKLIDIIEKGAVKESEMMAKTHILRAALRVANEMRDDEQQPSKKLKKMINYIESSLQQ